MREIIFRGKRTFNGEWAEGDLVHFPDKVKIDPHEIGQPWRGYDVIPETVGQYTGLIDKNGKKIYEGDIIEHHAQGDIIVTRGAVTWDAKDGRWAYKLRTMQPGFYMHNPDAVEVIGNVHDTPELLEVQQA